MQRIHPMRACLLLVLFVVDVRAFLAPIFSPDGCCAISHHVPCLLEAKKGRQGRRRKGRGSRSSSIEKDSSSIGVVQEEIIHEVPLPKTTKRVKLTIDSEPNSVQIVAYQVNDRAWWNHEDNTENPYGAKCWPSSVAVARYLADLLLVEDTQQDITPQELEQIDASTPPQLQRQQQRRSVFELGCGPGLPSLTAAACGAMVVASDISPVALNLLRDGWKSTMKVNNPAAAGNLAAIHFDVFSSDPLPIQRSSSSSSSSLESIQPIVVASAMMYDANLAVALAKRLVEAARDFGAWVIVGDDDTGEREGGRALLLKELERQLRDKESWGWTQPTVIKNKELGWQEKQVRLLHINAPSSVVLLGNHGS